MAIGLNPEVDPMCRLRFHGTVAALVAWFVLASEDNIIGLWQPLSFLRGRDFVRPEDVVDVAPDVLRHRIILSYDAISDSVSADEIVSRILSEVPVPDAPLESHVTVEAST